MHKFYIKHPKQNYRLFLTLKRTLDIFISVLGIILLLPLFVIIAIAIRLTSQGNVIFKHKRLGFCGNTITIYKFRTMVQNAHCLEMHLSPEQIEAFKQNYKLDDVPRLTRLGKFLRKNSLDELPQLLNVLKGDMSLVGPRPIVAQELEKYGQHANTLLSVKPGLTGLWQVSGRSDTTYEERVLMDIDYINRMCLSLDLKIIIKTFSVVFKKHGAY